MTDVEQSASLCGGETRKGKGDEGLRGRGTCLSSLKQAIPTPTAQHPPDFCWEPVSSHSAQPQVGQLFSAEHPSRAPSITALQILLRPPAAAGGGDHVAPSGTPRSGSHFGQGSKLFAPNTPAQKHSSINIF